MCPASAACDARRANGYHARPEARLQEPLATARPARSRELRAAVAALADHGEVERGAVYTRPEVVHAMLDLAEYTPDRPLHQRRLLEPSFGAGDFLIIAVSRLLAAFTAHGGAPSQWSRLRDAVRGVEVHRASFEATRARLHADLRAWGASKPAAKALCEAWLICDDFLLSKIINESFDVVIGNPPYVRQERIAGPLLAEYRKTFTTIYDRADLYIPFFERGLRLLAADGRLAFICANRWIKNRYGGPLRELVAGEYALTHHIDLDEADAFQADVLAYAAITVIRRGRHARTRIARRPALDAGSLARLTAAMLGDGPRADPRVEEVDQVARDGEPWLLGNFNDVALLRRLERTFPEIEEADCKVGIGVATGADRIFIDRYDQLPVEPTRKLRLIMAADLHGGEIRWGEHGIINPFEDDGSLASLGTYKKFARVMREHRETLAARHVARRSGQGGWYRTIDRIHPGLTATPKLLIPDIKGEATVVYDEGRYYPHHNLYYITSSAWDLRALATVLRSSVALLFISAYAIKMSGGFLRFQAQYLRRIRIPRWQTLSEAQREALRAASPNDRAAIDRATFAAYALDDADAEVVRRAAADARTQRKHG